MTEKIKQYLDRLFASLPATPEVQDAKEELYTGMVEKYNNYLAEGMEEQEAYDKVIEGVGDLRELFDELKQESGTDTHSESYEQGKNAADTIADFVNKVTDFTSGLVSGLFSTPATLGEMQLVNTGSFSLEGIQNIEISYLAESIELFQAPGEQLVVKEFMNQADSVLFANVSVAGGSILVRNGRRQGYFGLRSRVEVYLPAEWNGSLTLATVSGGVKTEAEWNLAAFIAKTISGEVSLQAVHAATVQASSTSGAVKAEHISGNMNFHSISGGVRIETAEGSGSFKTTSGSVRVNFAELRGDVDASSVSGGVRLEIPADASFEFDGRSISGGIHTGFDSLLIFQRRNKAHGFVGTAPFYHVRTASTSGSIHVND